MGISTSRRDEAGEHVAEFGFCGAAYQLEALSANAQRCVNIYPEIDASGSGKSRVILRSTPGLHEWCTGLAGPIRGVWSGGELFYCVAGSTLYSIDDEASVTVIGTVANDLTPVQFFPTQAGIAVVSANKLYWWGGVTLNVAQLDGEDLVANAGAFLDSYFIVINRSQGEDVHPTQFRWSDPMDAETWDLLDFASKEGYSDALAQILGAGESLWLFGSDSIEVWRNNYSTEPESAPWERDPGAMIHMGLKAVWSVVRTPFGVGWLGGDQRGKPVAYIAQGFSPQRVSTIPIEEEWASYPNVNCVCFTYTDGGHDFWVFNFPDGDATWVYDMTTQLWHQRTDAAGGVARGWYHTHQFGKHLVGDYENGTIWEMSRQFGDEDGAAIPRIRTAPYIHTEEKQLFHHRMEIDFQSETDLDVSLDWSNNSARDFSTPIVRTTGPGDEDGELRAVWHRLGKGRHRVYRASFSSTEEQIAIINAYLNASGGIA